MKPLRGGPILLALVAASGLATAQDPSVNESDFDTTAPPADESYLDDGGDPTVTESDFDTSVPPPDESYLDDGSAAPEARASTPGLGLVAVAVALASAALVARRR